MMFWVLFIISFIDAVIADGGECTSTKQCWNGGTCYGLQNITTITNSTNSTNTTTTTTGVCRCTDRYSGDFCKAKCKYNCLHGGFCHDNRSERSPRDTSLPDVSCQCRQGWMGDTCSEQYMLCLDGKKCLNGGVCRSKDESDDGTQPSGRVYRCECDRDFQGDFCETINAAKEKEMLQEASIAAATAVKPISIGEYFGIMLGVGLAIGITGGALILLRRKNGRNTNSLDVNVMDTDGSSTMNHTMTMREDNTTRKANGDRDVDSVHDNEII